MSPSRLRRLPRESHRKRIRRSTASEPSSVRAVRHRTSHDAPTSACPPSFLRIRELRWARARERAVPAHFLRQDRRAVGDVGPKRAAALAGLGEPVRLAEAVDGAGVVDAVAEAVGSLCEPWVDAVRLAVVGGAAVLVDLRLAAELVNDAPWPPKRVPRGLRLRGGGRPGTSTLTVDSYCDSWESARDACIHAARRKLINRLSTWRTLARGMRQAASSSSSAPRNARRSPSVSASSFSRTNPAPPLRCAAAISST